MLRIIRGRSSAGSGCVLSDFGGSSFDETISDRDTISDCSVRYFCESTTENSNTDFTPSTTEATNMAAAEELELEGVHPIVDKEGAELRPSIENSMLAASLDGESIALESASFRQGE